MDVKDVSCVLVTRGDVDLKPVLTSLPFDDIVVWDNSKTLYDYKVLGRYRAIRQTKGLYVYTQDDDAICPAEEIVSAYDGSGLLVNVPPGEQPWLAWGAVFPRSLPFMAFRRYMEKHPQGGDMLRWPDVVFAHMTGWTEIDLGHEDLPWATAENRMYHQPDHYTSQNEVRERCKLLCQ